MHFFTSITTNYLPKARVLARSVKKHNPDAVFHLVLSDELPANFDISKEPFDSLLFPQDLGIENFESWVFKHAVVELCTAVKGAVFLKIFTDYNAEKVVYLDPDIVVFHNLNELSAILDHNSIVLTPHLITQESTAEAILDNEICSLKHGIYNLGFLGVRGSEAGLTFIKWWRDRLLDYCYDDIPNGLFTDQRWIDLAPAMFEDVFILRNKTYNVATWNISQRQVKKEKDGILTIDNSPIKFYHFSGFDSGSCDVMLGRYGRGNQALLELCNWYLQAIDEEGQQEIGKTPCIYSFYSNGELITKQQRELYRSRADVSRTFLNPSLITADKHCYYHWYQSEKPSMVSEGITKVKALLNQHPHAKKVIKKILQR